MTPNTIDRINQLTEERLALYRQASNGLRGNAEVRARIAAISAELERLWDQRRQERAGHRDGIDLFVDAVYRSTYGRDYEESIAPSTVGEPEDNRRLIKAAA
jgi:hypothetical protein